MIPHPGSLQVHVPWAVVPVLVVLWLLFSTRALRGLDSATVRHDARSTTIDGLRALLALGVFVAHASGYYRYVTTGVWGAGPSVFFNQLGDVGVDLFFIITSYLFWGKALAASPRIRDARGYARYLLALYVARFFRIAPLYYCVIGTMLLLTLSLTGWHLAVDPVRLVHEVANWLALGLGANVWVNGSGAPPVLAGMVWTLAWEWYFYFSLAVLSLLAFVARARVFVPGAAFLAAVTLSVLNPHGLQTTFFHIALFCIGMTVADLMHRWPAARALPEPIGSLVAAALAALCYAGAGGRDSVLQLAALAVFFYLTVNGCSVFGLLRSRAAQRLGTVSYGIYLTHGICLHVVFAISSVRAFACASVLQYWVVVLATAVLVTGVATLSWRFVEAPAIRFGRALPDALGARVRGHDARARIAT